MPTGDDAQPDARVPRVPRGQLPRTAVPVAVHEVPGVDHDRRHAPHDRRGAQEGLLGSLSTSKPSIKVDFGHYIAGQSYLGMNKITLNNSVQDPSYLRQCLTYPVFAAAGIAAPRCNFAHVRVNSEDLGLYVNVETFDDGNFLDHHFANGDGNLYEGTLSDFRGDYVNTFDPKTNSSTADRSDLQPIAQALANAKDTRTT
jgi:spore coat protein CotH